jgi:Domain of unknown function (DUF3854)
MTETTDTPNYIELLPTEKYLNDHHLAELLESAINERIARLNFESLSGNQAGEYLLYSANISRLNSGRISSKYKPYELLGEGWWCCGIHLDTQEEMEWGCFKPQAPRIDTKKNKPIKYEHPPKESTAYFALRLPFAIGLQIAKRYGLEAEYKQHVEVGDWDLEIEDTGFWAWAIAQKGRIPLIFTEGAKKAACLLSHGYFALGLSGIWGAYRKSENFEDDPILLEGLTAVVKDRAVIFVFDQDTKPQTIDTVNRAINCTAAVCTNAGATECHSVTWPLKDYPFKGVDDLIKARGIAVFDQLMKRKKMLGEVIAAQKQGVTEQLVSLAQEKASIWYSTDEIAYADVMKEGARATFRLNSEVFARYLRREYHAVSGQICTSDTIKTAVDMLCAVAEIGETEMEVFSRVGKFGDRYYLDLGTPDWRAIEYSAEGWKVVSDPPVRFERARKGSPLPTPVGGGNLLNLFEFINAEEEDFPLLTGFLLKCLVPDGTEPILILHGEQGSGKSSAAEVLKRMVDPSTPNLLKNVADVRTVAIHAQKTRILLYDNLSYLSPETSDLMCSMSTGGGHVERALYSNDELTVWAFKRPQILTGIDEVATRGDLLDRSLMVELSPITGGHYRAETDYWTDFTECHPYLLGALLDAVCAALKIQKDSPKPVGTRMVDFAHIATAADIPLGYAEGAFMARLLENKDRGHEVAIESSPVAIAVNRLVKESLNHQWEGTLEALMAALILRIDDETRRKKWPTSNRILGREIARISPNLRGLGISVVQKRQRERIYCFTKQ